MSAYLFPAAMSVFGAIQGYNSGKEMEARAREQDRLAEQNALLARRELQEQVRRQSEEDYRVRSAALARAAASGATVSGSVSGYLEYMETEQQRQMNWLKSAGASRIRLQLASDLRASDALRTQANTQKYTSLVQGALSAFSYMDAGGMFTKPTNIPTTTGPTNRGGARRGVTFKSGATATPVT